MSQRANNRKGWGTRDTTQPTPDQLNNIYTHGQFFVPAGALTPGQSDGCIIEQFEYPASNAGSVTVAKFPTGIETEGYFSWGYKKDFVNTAIAFKLKPTMFVKDIGNEGNVVWSTGVVNALIGSNLNINAETTTDDMTTPGPDTIFDIFSGDATDAERAFDLGSSLSPDNPNANNMNTFNFLIERHGENVSDTLSTDVFLLGLMVQWAVDFNNIGVWPTA